ncbi:MAG: transcription antitermination factor NusB [Bacteroidota bacterium]
MLSRRHLRVKVSQVLYTCEMDKDVSLNELDKYLHNLLQKSEELYYLILIYLMDIASYSKLYKERKSSKLLATVEDLNTDDTLSNNPIILYLAKSAAFQSHIKRLKIIPMVDSTEVKRMFEALVQKDKYQEYTKKQDKTIEDERSILIYIVKKIIDNSEDLFMQLDADFLNLSDDFHVLNFLLQKDIEKFSNEHTNNFIFSVESDKEDLIYCKDLLEMTYKNQKEIEKRIEPKLKGWDLDRIAVIDMVILKMAVSEFLYFPFIPVKVTMNEYIEIAKNYSTPKSKDFINGLLDKLMHDLKSKGEIVKKGRGLVEH